MSIDHVTYDVPSLEALKSDRWARFFDVIEMHEIEPDAEIEGDYDVRWFAPDDDKGAVIHLVVNNELRFPRSLGMGHFCAIISREGYAAARASEDWVERDSGSGRIWLFGPHCIRVEVRPES